MEKLRNLSLRKTIVLYLLVTLVCSYFLSYFIVSFAGMVQSRIWEKYADEEYRKETAQAEAVDDPGPAFRIERPDHDVMSREDVAVSETCDFLETYSVLVFASAGTVAAVWLFYRNKLRTPFQELSRASARVADGDLDFCISYENKDEMGRLCREFERMRVGLAQNNRQMWSLYEQEKALRTCVAHDIRSPLAVLKGYQEMLMELARGEQIDEESLGEMLREQMAQIGRMEAFLDAMQKLSSLEQRRVRRRAVLIPAFAKRLGKQMELLAKDSGKTCELLLQTERETAYIDEDIVTEVLENLFTNALRYARRTVTVTLRTAGDAFQAEVRDDGAGFSKDAGVLTRAGYHANPQGDLTHFGMGLYICRLYCEKHGGHLLLGNAKGARALAVFAQERQKPGHKAR